MSGGSKQPSTTTQVSEPWSGQKPYLLDLFAGAKQQFQQGGAQYFPGQTVAPQSADTQAGLQMMRGAATGMQPVADAGLNTTLWNLGAGRDVANNPYLQSAIRAAHAPVVDSFNSATGPMSQIRGHFTAGNSGGSGTREGVAAGIAQKGLYEQLSRISAGMTMDAYNRAQEDSTRSLAMLPQTLAAGGYPGTLMNQVGGQQDAYAQSLLNSDISRWNYNQNLPWLNLQNFQNIVGQGVGGGSVATQTPMPQVNPWMGTLGGAASGAAIGSAVPVIGTGVGAGVGALLGYLGSR